MARPIDLGPDEEILDKHIKFSRETYELARKDAFEHTATGSISQWIRMLIRKHHGIKEIAEKSKK